MELTPERQLLRIIDANLNRTAEGLRVLEEIARMLLNDTVLSQQLKTLRHDLLRGDAAFQQKLLHGRDSAGDVGVNLEAGGDAKTKDLPLIIVANARRAQESLRVLEEYSKLPELTNALNSEMFKQARFSLYTMEQSLMGKLARQDKVKLISGLYAVIDTANLRGRDALESARQMIKGGVKVIQLRDKALNKRKLIELAGNIQRVCSDNGVLFIMNDYLDVALAVNADGLHVGQDDLPVPVARKILPLDKIIGCSVTTVEQAVAAQAEGADYIGPGAIFPTSSKDVEIIGVDRLREIRQAVTIPIVAIGGIIMCSASEVIAAGANAVAVISAILHAENIELATRQMIVSLEVKNEQNRG